MRSMVWPYECKHVASNLPLLGGPPPCFHLVTMARGIPVVDLVLVHTKVRMIIWWSMDIDGYNEVLGSVSVCTKLCLFVTEPIFQIEALDWMDLSASQVKRKKQETKAEEAALLAGLEDLYKAGFVSEGDYESRKAEITRASEKGLLFLYHKTNNSSPSPKDLQTIWYR